ncbi:capsid protein [Paucilactobacillus nenjiangensis]|uniref:Capsid protein n=1 Tax=Paucilactobacillus nenjiangensis TaxID=1296540 RepID=A0A5P1X3A9_9LACO|nr:capsid protein [Paucilactobacillus nenjiangensis]
MKVKVDLSGVNRKFSQAQLNRGRQMVANQALADMNKFVPLQSGRLRGSGHVEGAGTKIIWDSRYAHRQFIGLGITNYTTPGTGPHWDTKAKGMFMNSWVNVFKRGVVY